MAQDYRQHVRHQTMLAQPQQYREQHDGPGNHGGAKRIMMTINEPFNRPAPIEHRDQIDFEQPSPPPRALAQHPAG
jgi:hypothetical protein